MLKHIINCLAVGGFIPTLTAFYLANGQPLDQAVIVAVYALISFLAIKINV